MRRWIALAGTAAVALSLTPFGVAHAQAPEPTQEEDLVVRVTKPVAGGYAGTVEVAGSVELNHPFDSIQSVVVDLVPASGSGTYGSFCTLTFPRPSADPQNPVPRTDEVQISFNWNSTRVPAGTGATTPGACSGTLPGSGALTTNNKYKIQVTATTYGFPQDGDFITRSATSGELKVNNEPAKPTGVKLGYTKSTGTITAEWSKNAEPDVTKYRIEECQVEKSSKPCGSGDWKPLADDHAELKVAVKSDGPGIYRYRVAALRPSADGATMVSDWATAAGDPTEIEVKEDPPETSSSTTPSTTPTEVQPKTIVRPTRRVQRAAPQVVQRIVEEEPGYNTELPYQGEEAIGGRPIDDAGEGEGQRALLIPLAGGALLLVFAMQVHYLSRRAAVSLETVAPGPDGWDA